MEINKLQKDALETITKVMGTVSIFISIILGFLILYANNFLIKRRKKEFGIYMTLGMEKGRISKILLIETVLVGLFSLAVGLALGVFLSQGLAALTAKLFEVKLKNFQFVFSMPSLLKTVLYFSISFVMVMVFTEVTMVANYGKIWG